MPRMLSLSVPASTIAQPPACPASVNVVYDASGNSSGGNLQSYLDLGPAGCEITADPPECEDENSQKPSLGVTTGGEDQGLVVGVHFIRAAYLPGTLNRRPAMCCPKPTSMLSSAFAGQ
jgi:hypothetical protein